MIIIEKIFVSEKSKCYIKYSDNRSICLNFLYESKDIKNAYKINVIDLTDYCYKYYNNYQSDIKKYCTILLIDDINTSRIFISEKKYVLY